MSENNESEKCRMLLWEALEIPCGVTAVIGGGGKTTLIGRLAEELRQRGRVIVCTTTHIWPFSGMELLTGQDANEQSIGRVLAQSRCVCIGELSPDGKLTAPRLGMARLSQLADYVLVEADGAARRPLKAHASHEPALPQPVDRLLYVVGADGFKKPIWEAAHRPELYAKRLGVDVSHIVTPEDAANALDICCTVVINKADDEKTAALAFRMANCCNNAVITSLIKQGEAAVVGCIKKA